MKLITKIIYAFIGYFAALVAVALVFALLDKDMTFSQAFRRDETYLYALYGAVVAGIFGKSKGLK